MLKKQVVFIIILTLALCLVLVPYIGATIASVNETVETQCFDRLADTAVQLANDLYNSFETDSTILSAMSAIIASDEAITDEGICDVMNSYNPSASYFSYIELLRPDGTMLDSDGTVRDVSFSFSFENEAAKGSYISGIRYSSLVPTERVVRNAVPVVRDGEVVFVLFGTIRLSDLAQKFKTDIYDNNAYVYIEDGSTGSFLLDTWHNSFGSIFDFNSRRMLSGYDLNKAITNMENGVGGDLGYLAGLSETVVYLHYEPIGVNNWNMLVAVEQQYAMLESNVIRTSLYHMAVVIGVCSILYMLCVLYCLLRAYLSTRKLAMEDRTTGLKNRTAFDKFTQDSRLKTFERISCIYLDANGLHDINNLYGHRAGDAMLKTIAEALRIEFGESPVFRIGGDEFVVFAEDCGMDVCAERMENAIGIINANGYGAAFGIAYREKEMGVDRITHEADVKMLENKQTYYKEHRRPH